MQAKKHLQVGTEKTCVLVQGVLTVAGWDLGTYYAVWLEGLAKESSSYGDGVKSSGFVS